MRRLSPRVNVIPVIGKADSLTPSELKAFKKRVRPAFSNLGLISGFLQIMEDIDHYDIPVYNFPYDVEEDDEDTIQDNSELRVCIGEPTFHIAEILTLLPVFDAFRYHWLRRGSGDRRRSGSGQDLPLGCCRGRQPETLGLPKLEKGSPEVRRFDLLPGRSAITVGN